MESHSRPKYRICPHCGTTRFHKTQWKGFVERCVLYMWGLLPYQCTECYKRFYLRPLENAGTADQLANRDLTEGIGKPKNKTEAAAGARTHR